MADELDLLSALSKLAERVRQEHGEDAARHAAKRALDLQGSVDEEMWLLTYQLLKSGGGRDMS